MIVSGGKILAVGKVNTDNTTVSGDGVKVPLGVNGGIKTYSVEAGNENITVTSAYDGNNVIFKINGTGGGSGGSTYSAYPGGQIKVNNVEMSLALEPAFINSASSGYDAMKAVNENSAVWSKDTTYSPGSNIDITNQVVSGRDWTPELKTKVNADVFNIWSAGVETSAANLSAAIDNIPKPKYYDDVRTAVADNSANWNTTYDNLIDNSAKWNSVYNTVGTKSADWDEVSAKLNSADFTSFQTDFNTWSAGVETSAATMSAYIKANEDYWNNSSFNVQSTTPDYLTVASSYDTATRTVIYDVSAKEQKNYSAGNWVDSDKLSAGIVEVSGQKTFKTKSPLYFSADASDPNIVWLLQEDNVKPKAVEAVLIANGWYGDGGYYDNGAGLSASIPASNINAEYIFHFARQMGIQININAKFVAHASASDKIGKVGFGPSVVSGMQFTNPITYNMLGALGEQYYACSTITTITAANFPEEGIDVSFKFVGDEDFLKEIQTPCITVHEILVNEG